MGRARRTRRLRTLGGGALLLALTAPVSAQVAVTGVVRAGTRIALFRLIGGLRGTPPAQEYGGSSAQCGLLLLWSRRIR